MRAAVVDSLMLSIDINDTSELRSWWWCDNVVDWYADDGDSSVTSSTPDSELATLQGIILCSLLLLLTQLADSEEVIAKEQDIFSW